MSGRRSQELLRYPGMGLTTALEMVRSIASLSLIDTMPHSLYHNNASPSLADGVAGSCKSRIRPPGRRYRRHAPCVAIAHVCFRVNTLGLPPERDGSLSDNVTDCSQYSVLILQHTVSCITKVIALEQDGPRLRK